MTFVDDGLSAVDLGDHVINHIFGCGMTIAGMIGHPDLNDDLTKRLLDVIDELDMAVTAIRHAAFATFIADREACRVIRFDD